MKNNEWKSVNLHALDLNFGLSIQWTQTESTVYFFNFVYGSLYSFNLNPNNVNFKKISEKYDVTGMGFQSGWSETSQPCLCGNETHLFMHFNWTISYYDITTSIWNETQHNSPVA
eukprot:260163_1